MRRVLPILVVLVLAPSIATASLYRCVYDGITRVSCCCPSNAVRHKEAPSQEASVKSACCCTVTQVTSTAPAARANELMSIDIHPVALVVAFVLAPVPPGADEIIYLTRPRAQGDPPDTLFARRCSLLL